MIFFLANRPKSKLKAKRSPKRVPDSRSRHHEPDRQPRGGRGTNQYAVKGVSKAQQSTQKDRKPRVPEQAMTPRTKSEIAKASATRVDSAIQRYAEEYNEPRLAKALGGFSLADNQPVDVVTFKTMPKGHKVGAVLDNATFEQYAKEYGVASAIELKTMVVNKANKITMKRSAMDRKAAFDRKYKTKMATVVFDDSKVFNANGDGQHDPSQRVIRVRQGYGSFRVETMEQVGSTKDLQTFLTGGK